MLRILFGVAVGAVLAYFLDPTSGRRRRNTARDRVRAVLRRGTAQLARVPHAVAPVAYVLGQRAASPETEWEAPNDAALTQKVISSVFPHPDIPKGQVNVNAERGVVVLRGELERQAQIEALEAAVREVPGVKDVRNLLHLAGTPPPGAPTAHA